MKKELRIAADDFRAATANPHDIADTIRLIADAMTEDGAELDSTWQDSSAGKPWRIIAKELRRAAIRIEDELRRKL